MGRRRELSLLDVIPAPKKIWLYSNGRYPLRWTKERERHRINQLCSGNTRGRGSVVVQGGLIAQTNRVVRGRRSGPIVFSTQRRNDPRNGRRVHGGCKDPEIYGVRNDRGSPSGQISRGIQGRAGNRHSIKKKKHHAKSSAIGSTSESDVFVLPFDSSTNTNRPNASTHRRNRGTQGRAHNRYALKTKMNSVKQIAKRNQSDSDVFPIDSSTDINRSNTSSSISTSGQETIPVSE